MHTFRHGNVLFQFNSDLSGAVHVSDQSGWRIQIPGDAIKALFGELEQRRSDERYSNALTVLQQCTHSDDPSWG